MNRRALLSSLGATLTLTAGCTSPLTSDTGPAVQLGWFGVGNFDTEAHNFDVQVKRNDTLVHSSSHKVQARTENTIHGAVAECTWGNTPGRYTVRARVDENKWKERSLTKFASAANSEVDCVIVEARYRGDQLQLILEAGCDRDYKKMCSFTSGETEASPIT